MKLGNGRKLHTQAAARHPKKSGLGVSGARLYFGNALNFRPMMSARFLIVALLVLLASIASANPFTAQSPQRVLRVTGYVLDVGSRRPVVGAMVEDEYWTGKIIQVQTNSNGHFVLHLPVVKRHGKVRRLIVHTVLYEGEVAVTDSKEQQVVILLRRNAFRFKPYGCQQLGDSSHIPRYSAGPLQGAPYSQYAFLILDSTSRQPHKLRTVTLRFGDGFPLEPFRIRIYQYNGRLEIPGEDLLRENLPICPAKAGSLTYDVRAYDIEVAGNGFYLALEPVLGSDKFWCTDPMANYTPTGPILRPPCARADIRTWEYVIGKGWHRPTAVENCWPLYESAISVEVEPAPAKR